MKKLAVVAQVLVLLVLAQASRAANIYVSPTGAGDGSIGSPTNLQAALDTARTNAEYDTLYLSAGVYDASTAGANTFDFDASLAGSDGLPVTISGGWDAAFTSRSDDPLATALDGGVNARVLYIKADAATAVAHITLELVGILNGKTTASTTPPTSGAGILATQSLGGAVTLTVTRCVFYGNFAADSSGGAIAAQGPITVTESRFTYNKADTGGAVYLWATSTPALFAGCDFSDNSIGNPNNPSRLYGWQGSTILSVSPDLTVDSCEFHGMTDGSTSGSGSTIYVSVNGHLTVRNTAFRDINIMYWGSAIQLWDAAASISGCLFAGNRAGTNSGYAAVTYLDNTGGPGPQTTSIVNSTFVGNTTGSDYAGDIHFRGGILTIRNSIFFDNTSPGIICETGCVGNIDYSSVEGGAGSASVMTYGANNTTADPLFVAGDDDYHLQQTSPCVDTGSTAAGTADPLTTDFDGDPRVFAVLAAASPVVDMGWDEYYNGTLGFTAPAPGTFWLNDGTARSVTWVCQNISGDVRLFLWQGPHDGGAPVPGGYIATVPCTDQAFTWTPPDALPGATNYAVAMYSLLYPTVGQGIGPLAIQHLRLTSPNSAKWTQGSTYAIKWLSSGLAGAKVRIDLYDGDQRVSTITKKAPNTGSFSWKVPFTQAPGTTFRIKVSTTSPLAAEDFSDAYFLILPAVTLSSPNGGQIWKRGTTQTIAWKYKNSPGTAVRLELYKKGVFSRVIAASVPIGAAGVGSYLWTIPATQAAATTYSVKVSSASWAMVFDFSNNVITIKK